ncbi:allatostatin-A receptor-like [Lytechinus pictus]|uniref:allatostatin-A receptor-like n=1 Tax=Lytechinus pictus TaxID=7653 RepID=UPI0030BA2ABA
MDVTSTMTMIHLSTIVDWNQTAIVRIEWSWKQINWSYSEILHLCSAVLGIVGNLMVILALRERRAAGRSTDTLMSALAFADFMTSLFTIPVPSASTVPDSPLGQLYCKMTLPGFFLFVAATASSYILMAISVERFLAVVYPLQFNQLMARKQMLAIVISAIWIISFLVYGIFIATAVIANPMTHTCTLYFPTVAAKVTFGYFMFIYRFVLPVLVMLVTQVFIAYKLHRHSVQFRGQEAVSFHIKARNRVLKLMSIVIIVFVITWGPGQVSFFLFTIGILPPSYIGGPLHKFIIVFTTYNSCMNPVIYIVWFPEFRLALRKMFTCQPSTDGQSEEAKIETKTDSVDVSRRASNISNNI